MCWWQDRNGAQRSQEGAGCCPAVQLQFGPAARKGVHSQMRTDPPQARWRHLVFDLDGTLADTLADIAAALNRALQEHGASPLPMATVRSYVGEGAQRLVEKALPAASPGQCAAVTVRFLDLYSDGLLLHTRPYPGIPEALQRLRAAGACLSVLTNKPEALSRAILRGLGLERFFAALCGGDTLPVRKPHTAGLEYLCAQTATSLRDVLLVGDSGVDRMTANAAGVAFCGVLWGFAPDEVADAPLVVRSPDELVDGVLRGVSLWGT